MAFNVRQIFAALNDARVDYVVVGGLAVILHGYLIDKLQQIHADAQGGGS